MSVDRAALRRLCEGATEDHRADREADVEAVAPMACSDRPPHPPSSSPCWTRSSGWSAKASTESRSR